MDFSFPTLIELKSIKECAILPALNLHFHKKENTVNGVLRVPNIVRNVCLQKVNFLKGGNINSERKRSVLDSMRIFYIDQHNHLPYL